MASRGVFDDTSNQADFFDGFGFAGAAGTGDVPTGFATAGALGTATETAGFSGFSVEAGFAGLAAGLTGGTTAGLRLAGAGGSLPPFGGAIATAGFFGAPSDLAAVGFPAPAFPGADLAEAPETPGLPDFAGVPPGLPPPGLVAAPLKAPAFAELALDEGLGFAALGFGKTGFEEVGLEGPEDFTPAPREPDPDLEGALNDGLAAGREEVALAPVALDVDGGLDWGVVALAGGREAGAFVAFMANG